MVASLLPRRLDQPEVQHLDKIHFPSIPADEDVRRLDVPVDETHFMGFGQRMADLAQDVNGPLRGNRPELLNQRLRIEAVQELHDIKKGSVRGDAEVVQSDCVRRAHGRRRLRLAFEAVPSHPLGSIAGGAHQFRPYQLNRSGPSQHTVPRQPHLAHSSTSKQTLQLITSHPPRLRYVETQSVDDLRCIKGNHDGESRAESQSEV